MDNFNFYSLTEFVFGKGRESECGKYVKKNGGTKVLIHYGGGSVVRSGLLDRVKESLTAEGIPFAELGGVQPNPRDTKVYEGIELCKAEGVDFILAVGGGSVIDSSKAIALGALYDGDFWDFYDKKAVITKALPVGTVLTIAAAGSEGSGNTVITKTDGMWKRGAGLAVMMPAWMEFVMTHNVMRFAQMAVRVFGVAMNFENPEETAKLGIKAFRKFLRGIGMPINFAELGAKEEDIPELAEKFAVTKIGANGTTGGFVKLTKDDAAEIYRIAVRTEV